MKHFLKTVLSAFLILFGIAAQATSVNCFPSTLGGTGSVMVYSTNTVGRWVGWWCPGETAAVVFACRTASCPTGAAVSAKLSRIWDYTNVWTFNEMVYALPPASTVKDVWQTSTEWAKLAAVKPK